ncbi:uncharacterized protein LOC122062560 [Macadamia integrifolia]|uniref:uncharacterized protein LOC122062560 n=1 Tax=Macadamia integrifolia TaxID=60698 RepID=UPI001C500581|nr:uncharacterized protein LOC122062560 [Macadamia integrifolia]
MATSAREGRRRRIVERGSDRLALITGQIQNLPPPPPSSSSSSSSSQSHHSHAVSSPDLYFDNQKQQSHRSTLSTVPSHGEEDAPGTASAKYETSNESASNAAIGSESRMEPWLQKCETSVDYLRDVPPDTSSKTPASITLSSAAQNLSTSMVDPEPRAKPRRRYSKIFTAKQISSSISASERTRLLCSIGIALLVVLSHLRIPLLSSSLVRSIIATRPVYLVLLTDVSLVLALLLLEKKRHSDKAHEEARQTISEDGFGWAEGLGRALEMGFVLQKVISAAFLDCSVYVVIIVCGLSLVQRWF